MSRDERWRRVRRRSTAIACIVAVTGAWLLLARPLGDRNAQQWSPGGARFVIAAAAAPEHARSRPAPPQPSAEGAPNRAEPAFDPHDAPAPDLQHPLTAEHRALYRDSDLLDASWRALQAHDFARAREVLAQHRAESTRTHDDLNDGLTILADCMQHPSATARERAQRFYDEQTFSMARRRIRRYCLEAAP